MYFLRTLSAFVLLATAFLMTASKPIVTEVSWISFSDAVAKSKSEPRKIFIDVYTDWCGWCKVMDKKTFNHPTISAYLNQKFYTVKFNAEQKEDVTFGGTTYKYVTTPDGRGYHEFAAALLQGKMAYPTVVILDENVRVITPVSGYQEPLMMDKILKFFGDDHFKNKDWESFDAEYQSPIK